MLLILLLYCFADLTNLLDVLWFWFSFIFNEWYIEGIKLNVSIAWRKFWVPPWVNKTLLILLVFLSLFALSESPSRSSVLRLYSEFIIILRVTSSLFVVFAKREKSHWVLASFPCNRKLWSHSNQWEWEM